MQRILIAGAVWLGVSRRFRRRRDDWRAGAGRHDQQLDARRDFRAGRQPGECRYVLGPQRQRRHRAILCDQPQGSLLGTFPLAGAPLGDWEDIAIGPKPGGGNYLYLGDIGDNNAIRSSVTVYRTDEPQSTAGATIPVDGYTALHLQYPGGARDAESMFVDPLSGDLFIITKGRRSRKSTAFRARPSTTPAKRRSMTSLGDLGGAAANADGRRHLAGRTIHPGPQQRARRPDILFERVRRVKASPMRCTVPELAFHARHRIAGRSDRLGRGWQELLHDQRVRAAIRRPRRFIRTRSRLRRRCWPATTTTIIVVDAADYTVWRNQFGENVALPNETDTPGVVTGEDYDVWNAAFRRIARAAAACGESRRAGAGELAAGRAGNASHWRCGGDSR